ncbi:hypothetical protein JOE11_000975 [Robbsia andropogonis]|uniref:type III secretion system chaperone n=1 Tax=Robbsia andropogonis TaxID=28092 RepID=UPI0012FA055E|nr:type III secretion system chaperone [Robbsia andropogonis]MCP1117132.1 type III secretion system chaperone [Robbsia andropogonis]MCP1128478.1 type III secretion system chaperone [Robbsia andropogonis]
MTPIPATHTDPVVPARSDIAWTYDTLRMALMRHGPSLGMTVDQLWNQEELRVDGLPIGMMCDGDPTHGDILLYAALGKPLQEHILALNRQLLEGNHHGAGTGGCTLGQHRDTGVVTLYARLPIPITQPASLIAKINDLKHVTMIWRRDVHTGPVVRQNAN